MVAVSHLTTKVLPGKANKSDEEKEALKPVPASTVPAKFKAKPIFLHDIYDEKFLPDGTFDKDKARFVCGETKKNTTLLDSEKSTPTPSPQSILLNGLRRRGWGRLF